MTTAVELLDAAQGLVQELGFNAFSYKDLAESVGIRTASVHYHFPGKAMLGLALMERYSEALEAELVALEHSNRSARTKLRSFIQLYRPAEEAGVICMCGSLAADRATLEAPLQQAVEDYLARSEEFVGTTLKEGARDGEFELIGKARDLATTLVASLQGGLILARSRQSGAVLDAVQRSFFSQLRRTDSAND